MCNCMSAARYLKPDQLLNRQSAAAVASSPSLSWLLVGGHVWQHACASAYCCAAPPPLQPVQCKQQCSSAGKICKPTFTAVLGLPMPINVASASAAAAGVSAQAV
jgi:hypothetical protein